MRRLPADGKIVTSADSGFIREPLTAADGAALVEAVDVAITWDAAGAPTPAGASLTIRPGEVVLLLGPSGSGKSTLTLALNGLIPHSIPASVSGSLRTAGHDVRASTVADLARHVAMVFQDPDSQLVTGTLLDEVAFGPENLCLPAEEVLRRAEAALRRVGLWERRTDNPDRLSGGGRQRLAIACALAMGSPLLVLDEPTANLDPAGIEDVYAALRDVVAAGDRAVLLVEHNLDAAMDLIDRVVVLDRDGHTAYDGSVDEVIRGHADDLHRMGVWLPVASLAALQLRGAGHALTPLPVTPDELRHALESEQDPPGTSVPSPTPRSEVGQDPVVTVRGLALTRRGAPILHDIDLTVHRGEFVALVGANGAGKTSLLQAIAGILPTRKGMVSLGGLDPFRADARATTARIGFVFQNPEHQFIAQSVREELAHGLRRQKLPDAQVRARTDEILERFGLRDKADVHPFLLSGGQKRRLSVGTALVAGSEILALDEPTFGQDRARAEELLSLLRDLEADGTTIIVVTHDMQLVTDYAHRTVVLDDGRIVADGPTDEVFGRVDVLRRAGLRPPPLQRALADLDGLPSLSGRARLADLPGGQR